MQCRNVLRKRVASFAHMIAVWTFKGHSIGIFEALRKEEKF